MLELPDALYEQIKTLCEQGDILAEEEQYAEALDSYWAALDLLPEPKEQWEAATWILGSIGDADYLSGDFEAGKDNLAGAITCPDGLGNPFLHLRLGECEFELNHLDQAAEELTRAYRAAGAEIFEEEDPKYFAFLKTRLEEPADGWE